jgi:hypothetical protein
MSTFTVSQRIDLLIIESGYLRNVFAIGAAALAMKYLTQKNSIRRTIISA